MPIKSNIQTPLKNPKVASPNPSIFMGKLYSPEVYSVSSKGPAAAPISAMAIVLGVELMRPQNDLGFHEMTLSFKGFTTFKKNGVQAIGQHHQPYSVNSRLLPISSNKMSSKTHSAWNFPSVNVALARFSYRVGLGILGHGEDLERQTGWVRLMLKKTIKILAVRNRW